ncbi:MAG: DUF4157 domain-containing protein [Myxococcota bacterium]
MQRRALRGMSYSEGVQFLAPGAQHEDPGAVHAAAAQGVAGGGGALPHAAAIQRAFGGHDVSGVKAHSGGQASSACDAMGAAAYASGDAVAFKGAPDLHTAAHEAAHVVQQRAGVSLSGGVGQVGDSYERHADQVADAVVQGKSAEGLLSQMSGKPADGAVQRRAVQRDASGDKASADAKKQMYPRVSAEVKRRGIALTGSDVEISKYVDDLVTAHETFDHIVDEVIARFRK